MRPVLVTLHVGSREVGLHTYGLLIAAGLAAGIALGAREARRRGLDVGRVLDFSFWATVIGLFGSRIAYGLVNAGEFVRTCSRGVDGPRTTLDVVSDCTRLLHVWEGGLVFYGGVVGGGIVAAVFARRERWSFWVLGDVFAPGLAIGHALGRLGCFAAGCCFGKQSGPWGVAFPSGSVAFDELGSVGALAPGASFTPPLHPTQLYEAGGELHLRAAPRPVPPPARPARRALARLRDLLRAAALHGRALPRRPRAPLHRRALDATAGGLARRAGGRSRAAVRGTAREPSSCWPPAPSSPSVAARRLRPPPERRRACFPHAAAPGAARLVLR